MRLYGGNVATGGATCRFRMSLSVWYMSVTSIIVEKIRSGRGDESESRGVEMWLAVNS